MTTYTENQLATRVLKDLGLVGADETPTSSDLEWCKQTIVAEVALIAAKGITIWNGSGSSVPEEYLTLLSRRLGLAIAPSYGLTDWATAQSAMREAERDLRILATKSVSGEPLRAEYF